MLVQDTIMQQQHTGSQHLQANDFVNSLYVLKNTPQSTSMSSPADIYFEAYNKMAKEAYSSYLPRPSVFSEMVECSPHGDVALSRSATLFMESLPSIERIAVYLALHSCISTCYEREQFHPAVTEWIRTVLVLICDIEDLSQDRIVKGDFASANGDC
jgi:hypothetical protein